MRLKSAMKPELDRVLKIIDLEQDKTLTYILLLVFGLGGIYIVEQILDEGFTLLRLFGLFSVVFVWWAGLAALRTNQNLKVIYLEELDALSRKDAEAKD